MQKLTWQGAVVVVVSLLCITWLADRAARPRPVEFACAGWNTIR